MPNTSMSTLVVGVWTPSNLSRTQPPTISARPPACRTASAMACAWSRLIRDCSTITLPNYPVTQLPNYQIIQLPNSCIDRRPSPALDEPIAQAGSNRVQDRQAARFPQRVHFGHRPVDGLSDRVRHGVGRLAWAARARGKARMPCHDLEEFGLRRRRIDDGNVNRGADEFRSQAFGQTGLSEFCRRVRPHVRHTAFAD